MFHQIEALAVDQGLTMAHLRGAIDHFVNVMFGEGTRTRVRASYFPFTEPSMETDFVCFWPSPRREPDVPDLRRLWLIELGGLGRPVNNKVLRACGIDPDVYLGFAFGLGIERALQLRHGVTDMHDIVEGDARFSEQFGMEVWRCAHHCPGSRSTPTSPRATGTDVAARSCRSAWRRRSTAATSGVRSSWGASSL